MSVQSLKILDSNLRRLNNPPRFERGDFDHPTLEVCRRLLGQRLVKLEAGGSRLSGLIVEAEAYIGQEDKGCHASAGLTPRNEVMWGPPGHAYVYFTYGMHWMLNFVTEEQGKPAAVLLRAVLPSEGLDTMRKHRAGWRKSHNVGGQPLWGANLEFDPTHFTDGPAKVCQALNLNKDWNGHDLCSKDSQLFIEIRAPIHGVTTSPRVGLNSVPEPWKSIPWRFLVDKGNYRDLALEEGVE